MLNVRNDLGARRSGGGRELAAGLGMALVALALLTTAARGQEGPQTFDVVGHVVDANGGQPLVGAWVSIEGSDWGSISNDEGRFRLPDMTAGPLVLSVEQLGYETLVWEGEVGGSDGALELALQPEPVVLEGLQVVTDRFRARRNAVATTVRAYDASDLAMSPQRTALDFVTLRAGGGDTFCAGRRGDRCLYVRGRLVEPTVFVDEAPVLGGLGYLDTFAPHELYMVEIYGGGRQIRAYTPRFMERAAKTRLTPIALLN